MGKNPNLKTHTSNFHPKIYKEFMAENDLRNITKKQKARHKSITQVMKIAYYAWIYCQVEEIVT